MQTTLTEVPERQSYRFSRDEFYQMHDFGMFDNQRVELIAGEIVTMAPMKNYHFAANDNVRAALEAIFGAGFWVRMQGSLDLSPHSVVMPDVTVIVGSRTAPLPDNPTTALLIVEVSDSTLRTDRRTKGSLYAASGIQDYWILNLVDRELEIHRDPVSDTTAEFGFRYSSETVLGPGDVASPLAMPNRQVAVNDLLP